jgi:5-methylcytosine-specific restriction endonuclease McrA
MLWGGQVAKEYAKPFYHSRRWERARREYMRRTLDTPFGLVPPGMCERCYAQGRLVPAKIVHHKVHITPANVHDPRVTLDPSNFERVCQECHNRIHAGTADRPPSRTAFAPDGSLVRR